MRRESGRDGKKRLWGLTELTPEPGVGCKGRPRGAGHLGLEGSKAADSVDVGHEGGWRGAQRICALLQLRMTFRSVMLRQSRHGSTMCAGCI